MLTCKNIVMLVWTSWLYSHLQILLHFNHFLSFAILASILLLHDFTFTFTVSTLCLWLRIHAWTQLNHFYNDSCAFAFCAFNTVFATFTFTWLTNTSSKLLVVYLLILTFFIAPWKTSYKVTCSSMSFGFPFLGPACFLLPPPEKRSNNPPKP